MQEDIGSGRSRGRWAVDLVAYVVVAGLVYAGEKALRAGGLSPFPAHFDGGLSLLVSLAFVLALVRLRGQTAVDVGLRRPKRWWHVPVWGLGVFVVTVLTHVLVVPVLASVLSAPEPDLSRYDAIVGNFGMYVVSTVGAMVTGGFIEEVIYRGFVVDRFSRLLGGGRGALWLAGLLSGLPFGLIHLEWGFGGIVSTAVMGSTLGLLYVAADRNLWPMIAAHATLDLLLMTQLYLGMLS